MDKHLPCWMGIIMITHLLSMAVIVSAQPVVVWSTQFGTTAGTGGAFVVTNSENNIWVAGNTDGNLFGVPAANDGFYVAMYNSEGTRLWGKQFASTPDSDSAEGIAVDADNNSYVVGWTDGSLFPPSCGSRDVDWSP